MNLQDLMQEVEADLSHSTDAHEPEIKVVSQPAAISRNPDDAADDASSEQAVDVATLETSEPQPHRSGDAIDVQPEVSNTPDQIKPIKPKHSRPHQRKQRRNPKSARQEISRARKIDGNVAAQPGDPDELASLEAENRWLKNQLAQRLQRENLVLVGMLARLG